MRAVTRAGAPGGATGSVIERDKPYRHLEPPRAVLGGKPLALAETCR